MKVLSALVLSLFTTIAFAAELTIVGKDGARDVVDADVLAERFPAEPFTTANPWVPTPLEYTGIDLQALLDAYGLDDVAVRLSAIDNYSVVMHPGELATLKQSMLAITKGGKPLSRRDFGPSWLMMNFDAYPEIDVERTRNLSIWQLTEIRPE